MAALAAPKAVCRNGGYRFLKFSGVVGCVMPLAKPPNGQWKRIIVVMGFRALGTANLARSLLQKSVPQRVTNRCPRNKSRLIFRREADAPLIISLLNVAGRHAVLRCSMESILQAS